MEKVGEKVMMLVLLSTAMTDEQILEIARSCRFTQVCHGLLWECWEDQILAFARAMYDKGRDDENY
jgi:hypothetical protein